MPDSAAPTAVAADRRLESLSSVKAAASIAEQRLSARRWSVVRMQLQKQRLERAPISLQERPPKIPRSVSRRIWLRPTRDRSRSGCRQRLFRGWRIQKNARHIAHSDEPRSPCRLSSQGSRFGANEIHQLWSRRAVISSAVSADSGERTRPRVLVSAPSPKQSFPEVSSQWRWRHRQHAWRVRSPQIMFTAPQFGQV